MALFKKKPDAISDRARELNAKIEALQTEIERLSRNETPEPVRRPGRPDAQEPAPTRRVADPHSPSSAAESKSASSGTHPNSPTPAPQPRLRSTALPHGPTILGHPQYSGMPHEPAFEALDHGRLKDNTTVVAPEPPATAGDLDVRQTGWKAFYERLMSHFRGPSTSNPKLVNYLAAGSIGTLRPLRYEKRIERNRFIVLAVVVLLVLWGIIAILVHK